MGLLLLFMAYIVANPNTFVLCNCHFKFQSNNEKYSPLLLDGISKKMIIPNNGEILISNNKQLTIYCQGVKNLIDKYGVNETNVHCINNSFFHNGLKVSPDDLICQKRIKGEVQITRETCKGKIYNIGYWLPKKQWFTLIKTCYLNTTGRTLYTSHNLYGREIDHASKSDYRPSFKTDGLENLAISIAYKKSFQKAIFSQLLGSATEAEKYINEKSFLAKGHLSPDADFLMAPWQYTSYFYINTCPQWQTINGGNWKRLESLIRKTASRHNSTYEIFTGTHEVLQLPDINKKPTFIFLQTGNKIPVPKYLWKIVYDPKSRSAIVFIAINNPYLRKVDDDALCENVCKTYGWNVPEWSNIQNGFVFCCAYHSVSKGTLDVPHLRVEDVLKGTIKT